MPPSESQKINLTRDLFASPYKLKKTLSLFVVEQQLSQSYVEVYCPDAELKEIRVRAETRY
jgi:hypothetical protein